MQVTIVSFPGRKGESVTKLLLIFQQNLKETKRLHQTGLDLPFKHPPTSQTNPRPFLQLLWHLNF